MQEKLNVAVRGNGKKCMDGFILLMQCKDVSKCSFSFLAGTYTAYIAPSIKVTLYNL